MIEDNDEVTSAPLFTIHADEIAMDLSGITPEMAQALHDAQQAATIIPKRGWNDHSRYHYATAEDVIDGARSAMAKTGLSFMLIWGRPQPPRPELASIDIGKSRVGSYLPIEATLIHAGATVGIVRVKTGIDVLVDARRPPDKAVQAARTYAHGFILCSLLNLDRGDRDEEVDARSEAPAPAPARAAQAPLTSIDVARNLYRTYASLTSADTRMAIEDFAEAAFGPEAPFDRITATDKDWDAISGEIRKTIAQIRESTKEAST